MTLWEHQRELLEVACRRNVLVSGPSKVGKTFLAAWLLREQLASGRGTGKDAVHIAGKRDVVTVAGSHKKDLHGCVPRIAIAVAATAEERHALQHELARLCGERIWCEDAQPTNTTESKAARDLLRQWRDTDTDGAQATRVAVVSPKVLGHLLRKRLLAMRDIDWLLLEGADEIHRVSPSLFRVAFDPVRVDGDAAPSVLERNEVTRIFATTATPVSALDWNPQQNPLFRHIQVLSMVPVLSPEAVMTMAGQRMPAYPPLLAETFEPTYSDAPWLLPVEIRDYLFGANDKKIDFVFLFRSEIEMGNSAAVYDERKKQERVNRFIQDAESVYQHLGLWCLLKFMELEMLSNLQACIVEDHDNVNHMRKRQRVPSTGDEAALSADLGNDNDEIEDGEVEDVGGISVLKALFEANNDLDDAKRSKIQTIFKVMAWLATQATKVTVKAATPRLLTTANVVKNRVVNNGEKTRSWVFVERRTHCGVTAEYMTAFLADFALPPCCSMLGSTNARISGSIHFSSYLKVITMFNTRETKVMVTTSMAKVSQRRQLEPESCDLVVVMDELLEPDKLLQFGRRADPATGVIKYVMPGGNANMKKYKLLVRKMKEILRIEIADQRITSSEMSNSRDVASSQSASLGDALESEVGSKNAKPRSLPQETYELKSKTTDAVLTLQNSEEILSNFCDTIPGLDTYDRRPAYSVERHRIAGGISAATKQYKKKKLKYNAKLDDKIEDCKADAEARSVAAETNDDVGVTERFEYTATLKLPIMLRVKKQLASRKVSTPEEAKSIVAFKACSELYKKTFLDDRFQSTLRDNEPSIHGKAAVDALNDSIVPGMTTDTEMATLPEERKSESIKVNECDSTSISTQGRLKDLSTQNTYDLPPVSAKELGLRTVRSLTQQDTKSESVTMCFYGIKGMRFAILATNELYTGNTNTGWRYDFATSEVMKPVIHPVTLQKKATPMKLTLADLQSALHFHLIMMRLVCMSVDDGMRDVNIVENEVWNEFSEQNDKGYLVVPSQFVDSTQTHVLDWEYLREIVSKPLLMPCWPLPLPENLPVDEWVCVPTHRRNVSYAVERVTEKTAGEAVAPLVESDEAWYAHMKTSKSTPGNPSFGRWHTRDQVKAADSTQPLIHGIQIPTIVPLIRRVMQRNHDEGSIAQAKSRFNERLLLPEYTSLLRLTKSRFFEAMGIVPLLYEFERKCQMSNLMTKIGMEVDMSLLDDATTKPAYERLEILGDTFLKLETSWFMYENRSDVVEEGALTQLRRDIIRNDRLNIFALAHDLQHYILYPAEIEQHPLQCWKPSCMGKTPDAIIAPSKWIADVLEAICGAYLLGQGEEGARYFLKWIGVSVLESPHIFAQPFYPDCVPNARYDDNDAETLKQRRALGFAVDRFEGLQDTLALIQERLKYTFKNKMLLLEAITHPSVGALYIQFDGATNTQKPTAWKGNYERLEYLGDAVIEYITLSYAFVMYDKWLPGSLSQWKSATVSNDALGKTAIMCFGADEWILSGGIKMDRESIRKVSEMPRKYARVCTTNKENTALPTAPVPMKPGVPHQQQAQAGKRKTNGLNMMALPKMYADVFEALVAAVFLDSRQDLQQVRDVFFGPLCDTVGEDAFAYVCRESGLSQAIHGNVDVDMGELILWSDDEDAIDMIE